MRTRRDPGNENRSGVTGLRPLSDLYDVEVADDSHDVRGWEVTAANGERIGRVTDLLVDTRVMTTRYLLVGTVADPASGTIRAVALPVRSAQVDENGRTVRVALTAAHARALEAYSGTIPVGYERTIATNSPPVQGPPRARDHSGDGAADGGTQDRPPAGADG